jgi:hypothetical protein
MAKWDGKEAVVIYVSSSEFVAFLAFIIGKA